MTIYSGFSHWKRWFSIVMLVYQRVTFYLEIQWCFKFQLAHVQQIASRFGVSMLGAWVESSSGKSSPPRGSNFNPQSGQPKAIRGSLPSNYSVLQLLSDKHLAAPGSHVMIYLSPRGSSGVKCIYSLNIVNSHCPYSERYPAMKLTLQTGHAQ